MMGGEESGIMKALGEKPGHRLDLYGDYHGFVIYHSSDFLDFILFHVFGRKSSLNFGLESLRQFHAGELVPQPVKTIVFGIGGEVG